MKTRWSFSRLRRKHAEMFLHSPESNYVHRVSLETGIYSCGYCCCCYLSHIQETLNVTPPSLVFSPSLHLETLLLTRRKRTAIYRPTSFILSCHIIFSLLWKESTASASSTKNKSSLPLYLLYICINIETLLGSPILFFFLLSSERRPPSTTFLATIWS